MAFLATIPVASKEDKDSYRCRFTDPCDLDQPLASLSGSFEAATNVMLMACPQQSQCQRFVGSECTSVEGGWAKGMTRALQETWTLSMTCLLGLQGQVVRQGHQCAVEPAVAGGTFAIWKREVEFAGLEP